MWASEHNKITQEALELTIMNDKALQIVKSGCMLSDAWPEYHDGKWKKQHFSFNQDRQNTQKTSVDYIGDIKKEVMTYLKIMWDHYEKENQKQKRPMCLYDYEDLFPNHDYMGYILYCVGRASHCIQDFYAHSNWVLLNHPKKRSGNLNLVN